MPDVSQPSYDLSSHEVVMFDLDGVLLRGDTMASVVRARLFRAPWRLPAIATLLLRGVTSGGREARAAANRRIVRIALRGMDERSYEQLSIRVAGELAVTSADSNLIALAGAACERAQRVVVTTATERRLARAFLDRVGLGDVELLASEISFDERGPAFKVHNVGEGKITSARAAAIDPTKMVILTDSSSDLPLMLWADAGVLVAPSCSTLAAVQEAGLSLPVLHRARRISRPLTAR